MEIGLALPHIDDPEPFLQQVQTAERLGIHALWTYDRPVHYAIASWLFLDALGPPLEQRGRADAFALPLEVSAAGELDVFELLDAGEMAIDQAGVGQRPQVLGRLQFGGIRRQEEQVDGAT